MVEIDFTGMDWPSSPIDAASHFHKTILPQVRGALDPDSEFWVRVGDLPQSLDGVILFLPEADDDHNAWRLAAVQDLAREAAPRRVNAVAGGTADEQAEIADYLRDAPGITGQILSVGANPQERD